MNISSEIFPTDVLNFSDVFFHNSTEEETGFAMFAVNIIIVLLSFPINIYVIWFIVRGTGNGLAAEFFFLNLTACEMLYCIQCLLNLINYQHENLWTAEHLFFSLGIMGCPLFQCLICVERYLAVVHPVTFLKYKPLRYRAICSLIAWVETFVFSGIRIGTLDLYFLDYFCSVFILVQVSLFLFIQLFCLVAVLRALKQSEPGERAKKRKEENHMKRRAFLIILITAVTMLIKFLPHIVLMTILFSIYNTETAVCIGYVCFTFAGLVQPLLFLNRVGKIPFIKCH